MKTINLFNLHLSTGFYNEFIQHIVGSARVNRSGYACLANVHMLIESKKDVSFQHELDNAGLLLPDGKPITWALRILHGVKQERVAGMDFLPDLVKAAAQERVPVFFYGGSEELLNAARKFLEKKYPELPLAGFYSPPFRTLSEAEEMEIIEHINNSGAHIVFVILGCPKQEIWMGHMKGFIKPYMVGVGGALPVMIGHQKRAPVWMQQAGLEWLFRLMQEPKRLFKRYAVTNVLFISMLVSKYIRLKVFKKAF